MKKRKFKKGAQIASLNHLAEAMDCGWIWYRHKAYHPSFIISMQFRTIINGMRARCFFEAIPND